MRLFPGHPSVLTRFALIAVLALAAGVLLAPYLLNRVTAEARPTLSITGGTSLQLGRQHTIHGSGFPREALAYHTITDTWIPLAELPFSLVTTSATTWNNRIIISGGEQRPGVRSPQVWSGRPNSEKAAFGWANYATLSSYFFGMLAIGWICARRNKNTALITVCAQGGLGAAVVLERA